MQRRLVTALSFCAVAGLVIFFSCNDSGPTGPATPTKVGTWVGPIPHQWLPAVNDTVDHNFYLVLWDDNSYTIDDTLLMYTSQYRTGQRIQLGSWSNAGTVYTLVPSKCADPLTPGLLTAAACTQSSYAGNVNGNTFTLLQFFGDVLDVTLTKQ